MRLFPRSKKQKGWLVIDESPEEVSFVHGRAEAGARAAIDAWASADAAHAALDRIAKDRHFERYQCATLLRPGEYQLLLIDAPPVPAAELKGALRWKVKDMLDYPVEEATLDVLDIPLVGGAESGRAHTMFAVAAKNEVLAARIKRFEEARIPLEVIDIRETVQRNIAALYEVEKRGTALLYLERDAALLTINYGAELYLTRRLDVGFAQIKKYAPENRTDLFERIQVELQRTFDHFDRQHAIGVAKLVLGPEPEPSGLEEFLRANFDLAFERADLAERLEVAGTGGFDAPTQWRLFHLIGASLRNGSRA